MDTVGVAVYLILLIITGPSHVYLWWQLNQTIKTAASGHITMPHGFIPTMVVFLFISGLTAYGSILEIAERLAE